MKLSKVEHVVRYQISFDPGEVQALLQHPKWMHRIGVRKSGWRGGDMTLTMTEFSEVCDALGVNAREWMARHRADEARRIASEAAL